MRAKRAMNKSLHTTDHIDPFSEKNWFKHMVSNKRISLQLSIPSCFYVSKIKKCGGIDCVTFNPSDLKRLISFGCKKRPAWGDKKPNTWIRLKMQGKKAHSGVRQNKLLV